jgi:hypothetical protein
MSTMLSERSPQQLPVLGQEVPIAVAELLQQPRGALDVGEQQRDCSAGQSGHTASGFVASRSPALAPSGASRMLKRPSRPWNLRSREPADPPATGSTTLAEGSLLQPSQGTITVGGATGHTTATHGPLGGMERPRRKVRFARLIHRPVRALGRAFGPGRAAFGGISACPACHVG